VKQG
jgi:hypothetical protein